MKSPSDVTRRHPVERLSRSEVMSRIRSKNTAPELLLRRALSARKLRYRLHHRVEGIRADIVFRAAQVILEIDGCFWHGCPEHYVRPRSAVVFWSTKLRENVERDRRQTQTLIDAGWQVVRLWEHEVVISPAVAAARIECVLNGETRAPRAGWRVVQVEPVGESPDLERRHMEHLLDRERKKIVEGPRPTRKW